jgi:hypothetical protein
MKKNPNEKRGAAPGENRGGGKQGRKKSPENLVKVTVRIRQDQKEWELTNEQHRAALDLFKMTDSVVKFLSD